MICKAAIDKPKCITSQARGNLMSVVLIEQVVKTAGGVDR